PERETWVPSVLLAPAERYIVDARFDSAGTIPLVNHVQAIDHFGGRFFDEIDSLGTVSVSPGGFASGAAAAFDRLRANADVTHDIDRYRGRASGAPAKTLLLKLR